MSFDHDASRVKGVSVMQVLKVKSLSGKGEGNSPIREICDLFTMGNIHICTLEHDPELRPFLLQALNT